MPNTKDEVQGELEGAVPCKGVVEEPKHVEAKKLDPLPAPVTPKTTGK